jgi:hypothetical protein
VLPKYKVPAIRNSPKWGSGDLWAIQGSRRRRAAFSQIERLRSSFNMGLATYWAISEPPCPPNVLPQFVGIVVQRCLRATCVPRPNSTLLQFAEFGSGGVWGQPEATCAMLFKFGVWRPLGQSQGHFAPLPPILTFLLLRLGSGDVATPGQTQGFRNHLAPCAPAVLHLTPLSPKVTLPRFVNFSIRQGLIPRPSGAPFPKLKAVGLFKFGAA